MTVILSPYWSDGVQKLKVEPQSTSWPPGVTRVHIDCPVAVASPPPPRGHLPPAFNDSVHAARCLAQLRSKDKPIEKYIYLAQLKHANEELFYRLCLANLSVRSIRYFSSPNSRY